MEIVERIINYIYLHHLGKDPDKKCSEEIKYGSFLTSVAFPHEMRYRFETCGNWIKENKGLSGPKYL